MNNTTIKIAVFTADELREFVQGVIAEAVGRKDRETYTVAEFAQKIGYSQDTVRRRVEAGLIRKVPNTSRVLIPASEIDRLLGR